MKHFLILKCLLLSTIVGWAQTCDLELIGYTPPASENGLHNFVVSFTNAENCGCNEFTQWDGNNCENSTSSHVNNNETVSHIVFGIHYVDEETGEDYGEDTDCTSTNFHPGWSFVLSSNSSPSGGWSSGSSTTFGINTPFSWDCILENPIDGYCWEVVIWQINLSQTAGYDDFPDDGWSNGNSFNGTQTYPDINLSDNRITFCPDPIITDTIYIYETDTIIEYVYDTITITVPEIIYDTLVIVDVVDNFIYDTTYIELPADTVVITEYVDVLDTIYVDNYIYDTTYVDNYIYFTDTITEYILEQIYIDCETGLECTDEPFGFDCESTTLYVPNTFTPNNDGYNDVWKVVYESTCWEQIDFTIYNRWGAVVFRGADDEFWDGSLNGGSSYYVADGVYTYTLVGRREESLEYIQKAGMITLLR